MRGPNHQSGFTLVETVAGLAVLAILVVILSIFSGPLFAGLPAFGNKVRTTAQVGELQSLMLRIVPSIQQPWWWPDNAIEVTAATARVKDLSGLNTTKNLEKPDLLKLTWTSGELDVEQGGTKYQFFVEGTVSFQAVQDGNGRTRAVDIIVGEGDRAYNVLVPLVAAPLGGEDGHDLQ